MDGDTLVLLVSGNREERVRLSGIDCPARSPFGTRAKEALLARVGGEDVMQDDAFESAYREADELMRAARSDQVDEVPRLLAFEVACAERYDECLPPEELVARVGAADEDPASMELVTEGMAHLVEVLRRLRVTPS